MLFLLFCFYISKYLISVKNDKPLIPAMWVYIPLINVYTFYFYNIIFYIPIYKYFIIFI